jgi:sulfite exporter TauE/SafE
MMWSLAILTGLAGSLHCIGMCGPLAMALPLSESKSRNFANRAVYNLGRILSYGALGAIFGLLGKSFSFFGLQQGLSIGAGIFLLVVLFLGVNSNRIGILSKWSAFLTSLFNKLWNSKTGMGPILFGLVNGFLPCGLVYVALAGAVVTSNPSDGFIYMVLFGLGTFPAMYFVSVLKPFASFKLKRLFKKLSPVLVFIFACLFIIRGMNLGIPYLSPKMVQDTEQVECCHPGE